MTVISQEIDEEDMYEGLSEEEREYVKSIVYATPPLYESTNDDRSLYEYNDN